MDKDSTILKYLQSETETVEKELTELNSQNVYKEKTLDRMDQRFDEIYALLNKKRPVIESQLEESDSIEPIQSTEVTMNFDELYDIASSELAKRGFDVESIEYHSLVTEAELNQIEKEMNRALPRKEKWTKNDYIAVFIAASIGSLVDLILSDRENPFTGKESQFSKWLDQFHKHEGGAPIDYQGKGFGGGYHRGLSKGHDILRFIEAIIMFKNGQFEGIRYINGTAHKVISSVNQYGNPYEQLGLIEAILKYAKHMFGDLFSTCSLPFPGSSFLVESSNRDLRKLAANMYQNGFNLKNIMTQSLSTIMVEVILRIYFGVKSVQSYKAEFELDDDYSNFSAIKEFIKPSSKDKLYEMLLLSHAIVTAVNIGKVVIKKSPWELNVTEIMSVIRYVIPVVNSAIERNSEYSKIMRNADEIHEKWEQLKKSQLENNLKFEFISSELIIG